MESVLTRFMLAATGVVGLLGFALGFLAREAPIVDRVVDEFPEWAIPAAMGFISVVAVATFRSLIRRTESTWGRGLAAERRVGDRVEHALVRDGCAFAHDVKESLGPGGNVDHVVLTRAGVWVVETKAAWLHEERFKDALQQAAGNVQRVRDNLETGFRFAERS